MSQADELLNALSGNDISLFTARPDNEPHIVIGEDRTVTVPAELRKIAVQYDHNIETVTFDCPRYWDGLDMSFMYIYINYMCADGRLGAYLAQNVTVDADDENIMHFTWTISKNATMVSGALSFLICIKRVDGAYNEINHWNSELSRDMRISEGLECVEVIGEEYPDIITQVLTRMDEIAGGSITPKDLEEFAKNFDDALTAIGQSVSDNTKAIEELEQNISENVNEALTDVNQDIDIIKSQIADILYEPIAISSFSNNVGTVEIGREINSVTLSWKVSKAPTTLALDGEAIDISLTSKTIENLSITHQSSKKSWSLKATDERGAVSTKSTGITFLNRVRYGAAADYTELALSDGVLTSSKISTFNVTTGAGQYIWYILPSRLGTCRFKVGGFEGGFTLFATKELTNASGYSEEYYIYRSDNPNLGFKSVDVL